MGAAALTILLVAAWSQCSALGGASPKAPLGLPGSLAALAPRAAAAVWLLGGLFTDAPEARWLAAVALASIPGVRHAESAASLALCLVGLLSRDPVVASNYCWVPAFVFVLRVLGEPGARKDLGYMDGDAPAPPGGQEAPGDGSGPRAGGLPCRDDAVSALVQRMPNSHAPNQKQVWAWTKTFGLREALLQVYAGAVRLQLLHHGQLFLSSGHLCFQGVTVMTAGLTFALPLADVAEVRRGEQRDVATLALRRPVVVSGTVLGWEDSVSSIELQGCEAVLSVLASMLASGDLDEDSDDQTPAVSPREAPDGRASQALAAFADREPFRTLLEVSLPRLQVSALAEDYLSDDWGPGSLFGGYWAFVGAKDIQVGPWVYLGSEAPAPSPGGPSSRTWVREVTMMTPVPPAPMCPKMTRHSITYCFTLEGRPEDPRALTMLTSAISHDVPFGDRFLVQERSTFSPSPGGGVGFAKSARCVFLQSCGLLSSRIRSSSLALMTKGGEDLVALLRKRCPSAPGDGTPAGDGPPAALSAERLDSVSLLCPREATRTVHVWELQRRATVWHGTWHAPFLPHDGRKRWRWVDASYNRHAWLATGSREEISACESPPLEAPPEFREAGWTPLGAWEVDPVADNPDGWQHAVDFYVADSYWGESQWGLHARRRLWTRRFKAS